MFDKFDLSKIVGKHLVYRYDNGWKYEIYVKNAKTLDYRIHSGIVANRWVKNQEIDLVQIAEDVYKISWFEPTGTNVNLSINLKDNIFHGTIYFPRWVVLEPEKTVCFQNDFIDKMLEYRSKGPAYPTEMINEFATIFFIRKCQENDETIIACKASELPLDYPANLSGNLLEK